MQMAARAVLILGLQLLGARYARGHVTQLDRTRILQTSAVRAGTYVFGARHGQKRLAHVVARDVRQLVRCPPGLDLRAAADAARLAQLTYLSAEPETRRGMMACGFDLKAVVRGSGGTLALIGQRGSEIAVVFRGTANAENVALDLDFRLLPLSLCGPVQLPTGCAVHSGFGKGYSALALQLMRELRTLAEGCDGGAPAMSLLATGHSFGGALASLLLLDLAIDADDVEASASTAAAAVQNGASTAPRPAPAASTQEEALKFGSLVGYTFGLGRLGNDELARFYRAMHSRRVEAPPPAWRLPSLFPWQPPPRPAFALWSLSLADDPLANLPPRLLGFADHSRRYLVLNQTRAAEIDAGLGPDLGPGLHPLPLDELTQPVPNHGGAKAAREVQPAAQPGGEWLAWLRSTEGTDPAAMASVATNGADSAAAASSERRQWQLQVLTERAAAWQASVARMSVLAWAEVAQVAAGPMHLHFIASYCSALDELVDMMDADSHASRAQNLAKRALGLGHSSAGHRPDRARRLPARARARARRQDGDLQEQPHG